MNKIMRTILGFIALTPFVAIHAASMSIQVSQPKSPTTITNLNITFVVLDHASVGPITAKCFVSKDNGATFNQFGSDIAISTGGNTANCTTDGSVMNAEGTYKFYVSATNGSETVSNESTPVTVVYSTSGPGTPTSFGKDRANVCDYKISFRTVDDGGKTVKVEVYRSENTSFTADSGSKVDTIAIGSNTDGTSITTPPQCDKTYYFAVRAFDSAGNGSGLIGDSVTITTNTTVVTSTGPSTKQSAAAGAIPAGTNGNVLGAANGTPDGSTGTSGAVLGEANSPTPTTAPYTAPQGSLFSGRSLGYGIGALIVVLFFVWLAKRRKTS